MKTYSKNEIRQILCRYHNLDGIENLCGKAGAEKIMQRIGTIQYDPLNVVARNPDLVLQARVQDYKETQLYELLYKDHKLVDGYDKEMCIYNVSDFERFGFIRCENDKMMRSILGYRGQLGALEILEDIRNFVAEHGKTGTKDITIGEVRESNWGHKKLSSAALDYLFNTGELVVTERRGTQKYFDLTERVFKGLKGKRENFYCKPDMTIQEFLEWYVERRIKSTGIVWNKSGGAWLGHFVSNSELRTKLLKTLEEKKRITKIAIEGLKEEFYIPQNIKKYLKSPAPASYARFIAPLDNIMWDRQMLQTLFDFEYRWEVYTPAEKRRFGYYVLPVLCNGNFVARFEPESVKKAGAFVIKNWWWEEGISHDEQMHSVIENEMKRFARFLGVENSAENIKKLSAEK